MKLYHFLFYFVYDFPVLSILKNDDVNEEGKSQFWKKKIPVFFLGEKKRII